MRILRRPEFLALPPETFYMKATEPFGWGDLEIKGETEGDDFWTTNFKRLRDADSPAQHVAMWEAMRDQAERAYFDCYAERLDRGSEPDSLFLVFELPDLIEIRERIEHATMGWTEVQLGSWTWRIDRVDQCIQCAHKPNEWVTMARGHFVQHYLWRNPTLAEALGRLSRDEDADPDMPEEASVPARIAVSLLQR